MILHLSPGSGSIELHIHDDAQVALYRPDDRPTLAQVDSPTRSSRPISRMFVLSLTGAVCLALGYGVAVRGSAATARDPASMARSLAPLPSNIPLTPNAAALPRYEGPVAVPVPRPRAEAEPADGVPAVLTRQLAQAPVVVPPSAAAHPAAGSSAFGLEN